MRIACNFEASFELRSFLEIHVNTYLKHILACKMGGRPMPDALFLTHISKKAIYVYMYIQYIGYTFKTHPMVLHKSHVHNLHPLHFQMQLSNSLGSWNLPYTHVRTYTCTCTLYVHVCTYVHCMCTYMYTMQEYYQVCSKRSLVCIWHFPLMWCNKTRIASLIFDLCTIHSFSELAIHIIIVRALC